eukprot:TRINITY_DN21459_c0_g1_i1.p1 TRINITY_DN21459_c0_g1~~TRINITY_DN21459_c0_g1_i1.p1  ORF type:complete len:482 (-),score=75.29 TRINITY_DN21459_c0_g1_i1:66-1511(-)
MGAAAAGSTSGSHGGNSGYVAELLDDSYGASGKSRRSSYATLDSSFTAHSLSTTHQGLCDAQIGTSASTDVLVCLHSVHNVQHAPNESYYGMATCVGSQIEVPVTSERPARLGANIDSIVIIRVYLHERGAPSVTDRGIGRLVIPVREAIEACGPGIYQTWFPLEEGNTAINTDRRQSARNFRQALLDISRDLDAPRVCLTLLEASTDPGDWIRDEAASVAYFKSVLVSHTQHLETTNTYFDHLEHIAENTRKKDRSGGGSGNPGPVEAENLRLELERLQQKQRKDEFNQFQSELDHVTEEANRRIEKGNEAILKLKDQLKTLRDDEAPRLRANQSAAERRLEAIKARHAELKTKVERLHAPSEPNEELEQLKQEVVVLTKQKAMLMGMVQDVYGSSGEALSKADAEKALASLEVTRNARAGGNSPAAQPALAHETGLFGISNPSRVGGAGGSDNDISATSNLLPDPRDILSEAGLHRPHL